MPEIITKPAPAKGAGDPVIVFPEVLWEDLAKVDPVVAATEAKAKYIDGRFIVDFFCAPHVVDPIAKLVTAPSGRPRANFNKALVLLVYLTQAGLAKTPQPAGRLVGPFELPGGTMFFRGPHQLATKPLEAAYSRNKAALKDAALAFGAYEEPPALFRWQVLPNVDIACYFEEADDEFGAQAKFAFDAHAHYFLPLDALWALINAVTADLLPPRS
ncbi:MAG: DUF3786 domain-containing protein [Deltaproteobacteria bacterium]|jgi:hypothetical protein|nr:DUF3786 domain-containing protein [Deltaproteobacteria bacterium]